MLIYVIAEHYPSLFKPYFDTQFEQFVRDGHDVRIFAFARGEQELLSGTPTLEKLHRETRYLPIGRGSIPRFAGRILSNVLATPSPRLGAFRRARSAKPARVRSLTEVARLLTLPAEPPDVCLVHNLIAARWVRFLRDLYPGAPVAFYYHGGELPGVPEVAKWEAEEAFAAVDVVFTNTEKSRAHAISRGCPPERIHVSPVGFDLSEFPPTDRRDYRRSQRLSLLSIGRLSPEKGFNFAIEAARQLVQSGFTRFHYRILGGGPLLIALRKQIQAAGLEAHVEVSGPVPRPEVLRATREADILILPSIVVGTWEENQACVVQEAMLAQTIVLASHTGGVPESLAPEMRPFLVPEGDAAAIASAVREIAGRDDGELARLGQAGRRFVEQRYDIRRLNGELLAAVAACRDRRPVREAT